MLQFLIPSLIPLASHRQSGRIDFAAHFGGAIVGLLVGFVLLKIWPRDAERPRFQAASVALAVVSVLCLASSLVLAYGRFRILTVTARASAADLLVDDSSIPEDLSVAKRDVDVWGAGHLHDPRVRFYRALRLLDEKNDIAAHVELRAALDEREILALAFSNGELEGAIRATLSELLLHQGMRDEARRAAEPVCRAKGGSGRARLVELDLCR